MIDLIDYIQYRVEPDGFKYERRIEPPEVLWTALEVPATPAPNQLMQDLWEAKS